MLPFASSPLSERNGWSGGGVRTNRVSTLGNYTYDAIGNRKTDPTYSYGYDVEYHLTTLMQGSTTVLSNGYDGDGTRVLRTANNQTTHFVGPSYEYNVTTQTATTYCSFNGAPIAMKQGLAVTYLHHDQIGSLVSATNSIGGELFSARYWPFGSLRTSTGTAPSDRLFAGQTRDLGNDAFYHFPARYLDTTIGKFHTPDSVVPDPGNPQALNRYSYVLNQLLKLQDPSGHMYDDPSEGDVSYSGDPSSTDTTSASDTVDSSQPDYAYGSNYPYAPSDEGAGGSAGSTSSASSDTLASQGGDAAASVPEPAGDVTTIGPATASPSLSPTNAAIEAGAIAQVGLALATGNAWAATGAAGVGMGTAFDLTPEQQAAVEGITAGASMLSAASGLAGGGLPSIARLWGVAPGSAEMASIQAMQRALGSRVVPGIGGLVTIAQGVGAAEDLQSQLSSGKGDPRREVSDALQVAGTVVGAMIVTAVVVGAAPEAITTLGLISAGFAVASAVPYFLPVGPG